MPKPTKKQIEAMHRLGFSEEEIKDIIATDEAIDKGERVYFDLSPEKEKPPRNLQRLALAKPPLFTSWIMQRASEAAKKTPQKQQLLPKSPSF